MQNINKYNNPMGQDADIEEKMQNDTEFNHMVMILILMKKIT